MSGELTLAEATADYQRKHGVSGYSDSISSADDTEIIAAVTGKKLLVRDIHIHNKAGAEVHFTFKDADGGNVLKVVAVAANDDVMLSYISGISCGTSKALFATSDNATACDVDSHGVQK